MHVVAIAALSGPPHPRLAADLGTTPYELRLALGAGLPAVVLGAADEGRAAAAVEAIRRYGHAPVACDRRGIVASARMTALRDFRLEPGAIVASGDSVERLAYDDVLALLRATHRTTTETTRTVKERTLLPAMAIATGGLVLSKKTTREITSRTEAQEQVLYLFRRSGAPPWILRERTARYAGLGADLRLTTIENFSTTVRQLRERAPRATYDERLVGTRPPIRGVAEGIEAIDLLAYLLASYIAQGSTGSP